MLVRRLLNVFVNKVNPDQAALVRAAWPGSTLYVNKVDPDQAALLRAARIGSTLFAYGDMKYLIIHKWI